MCLDNMVSRDGLTLSRATQKYCEIAPPSAHQNHSRLTRLMAYHLIPFAQPVVPYHESKIGFIFDGLEATEFMVTLTNPAVSMRADQGFNVSTKGMKHTMFQFLIGPFFWLSPEREWISVLMMEQGKREIHSWTDRWLHIHTEKRIISTSPARVHDELSAKSAAPR